MGRPQEAEINRYTVHIRCRNKGIPWEGQEGRGGPNPMVAAPDDNGDDN
ncbi:hypothetical protein CGMCC3_g6514 [Colletotrichum fructicola]|nr:uncharacterized protein CGMCC3_g6514 [Colletotrichum fructicola]KAE9577589.1 hypothetical protein CGMCC3_g6514 [Colletotrichum fructicola]